MGKERPDLRLSRKLRRRESGRSRAYSNGSGVEKARNMALGSRGEHSGTQSFFFSLLPQHPLASPKLCFPS